MTTEKKSTGIYWLGAIVSAAVLVTLLIYLPAGFWVALPFTVAFTGKAFDII